MLFAINTGRDWITQSLCDNSGGVYIANASAEGGHVSANDQGHAPSNIGFDGNNYRYFLHRFSNAFDESEDSVYDVTNTEFNYAIYG
jgi:hypothetical protein